MTLERIRARLRQRRFASWPTRVALSLSLIVVNLAGIAIVFTLAAYVVPLPPQTRDEAAEMRLANLVVAAIVGLVAVSIAIVAVNIALDPLVKWIRNGADPRDEARLSVLSAPAQISAIQVVLWMLGAVGFGLFNAKYDPKLAIAVVLIVALAGWSTSSFTYLATERVMRSFARKALEGGAELPPHRSVVRRSMAGWAWGTGVVLLGSVLVGIAVFIDQRNTTRLQLALTMVTLGGLGLVFGGLASYFTARTTADPIRTIRQAMRRVERGDYDITVPIYDATEIGHLQAGFNRMAAGLQEREQLRDLFGRHVGEDVARNALAGGVNLGGEVRDVAVLFVDIIGSTTIAEDESPEDVVSMLNDYFDIVIDVVTTYGGWINKFEGDAALAIWGAPVAVPNRDGQILAAARTIAARLRAEMPDISAGVGVSAGRVVAGNVGANHRYEYTVIGDAVNEAARLTDVAKDQPELVAVNARLLATAGEEARHWRVAEPVQLRGRSQTTEIAVPLTDA